MPALPRPLPTAFSDWLQRRTTAGMLLVVAALMACALLALGKPLPQPVPALVLLLGLQVFVPLLLLAALGAVLWSGDVRLLRRLPYAARLPLFALPVAAAPLALFMPAWSLRQVSLAETGAGGSMGAFLTGSLAGLMLWAICCALLANLLRVQFGGRNVGRFRVRPARVAAVRSASYRAPARPGASACPGAPALTPLHHLPTAARAAGSTVDSPQAPAFASATEEPPLDLVYAEAASPRVEAFGALLILLAAGLAVWLVAGRAVPEPLPSLVEAFGLHVFTLLAFVAGLGLALWLREPDLLWRDTNLNRALPAVLIAVTGPLAFLQPDWTLTGVSLREYGAAGEVGAFLAAGPLGIGVWLLVLGAFATVAWPGHVRAAIALVPGVLVRTRDAAVSVVLVFWPAEPDEEDEAELEVESPLPQWLLWKDAPTNDARTPAAAGSRSASLD